MKAITGNRLRLAATAFVVAAVLVFAPLVTGVVAADTSAGVAVVDLDNYPSVDDAALAAELADADGAPIDRLIVISPGQPSGSWSAACMPGLPAFCEWWDEAGEPAVEFVPYGTDPVAALKALPEFEPAYSGALVTTLRQDPGVGWMPALEVGLLMTIVAAASLYFSGLSIQRRRRSRATARDAATVAPAYSVPAVPGAGSPAGRAGKPVLVTPATEPVPRAPAPSRKTALSPVPAPRPGPLPPDIAGAIRAGRRVVACTPFGAQGGYVDAGGLLLWATPEQRGEAIHPGHPLSVVDVRDDVLIVSSRITEEVRR